MSTSAMIDAAVAYRDISATSGEAAQSYRALVHEADKVKGGLYSGQCRFRYGQFKTYVDAVERRYVVGIHNTGLAEPNVNHATRINDAVFQPIKDWRREGA